MIDILHSTYCGLKKITGRTETYIVGGRMVASYLGWTLVPGSFTLSTVLARPRASVLDTRQTFYNCRIVKS